MAFTCGFFNALNGDRVYNADELSSMFEGLISDGIYKTVGDAFEVTAGTGMTVTVGTGRASVISKWVKNTAPETVDISAAHVLLNRYTAVVLRLNVSDRTITIETIDGEPASTPTKPAISRTSLLYDLLLAYIYVPANATSITQSNVEDMRANTTYCGWVTGMVTNTFIEKYEKVVTLGPSDSRTITLDMTGYTYDAHDVFLVDFNGLAAELTTDYTLNVSVTPPTMTVNMGASSIDQKVGIKVLKSIPLDL